MSKEKDYYNSTIVLVILLALYTFGVAVGLYIKEYNTKTLCEESGYFIYKNDVYVCYKEDMGIYKVEEKQ